MDSLNTMLLLVIADLNRRSASAAITVKAATGDVKRVVYVVDGCLVAADSNLRAERLGDMLAGEGRLDPVLIEPVANEARRRGTLLGDQLIADGLLTPSEMSSALERQSRLRFESALATAGSVGLSTKKAPSAIVKLPLGAAVTAAFRERINLAAIHALVADRLPDPTPLDLESEAFKRLELGPSGLKICRSIARGAALESVLETSPARDQVVRTIGVLVGLGLWS